MSAILNVISQAMLPADRQQIMTETARDEYREMQSSIAALRQRIAELEGALERIAAGNPGRPKWLTDIEMADIARAALDSR